MVVVYGCGDCASIFLMDGKNEVIGASIKATDGCDHTVASTSHHFGMIFRFLRRWLILSTRILDLSPVIKLSSEMFFILLWPGLFHLGLDVRIVFVGGNGGEEDGSYVERPETRSDINSGSIWAVNANLIRINMMPSRGPFMRCVRSTGGIRREIFSTPWHFFIRRRNFYAQSTVGYKKLHVFTCCALSIDSFMRLF